MIQSDFVAYVGDPEIHDSTIAAASKDSSDFVVDVAATTGRTIRIRFLDSHRIHANHPVGMLVYALTEMRTDPPWRRFVFANSDDDDDAALEIIAKNFQLDQCP